MTTKLMVIFLLAASTLMAQVSLNTSDSPELHGRCNTVAVESLVPGLPSPLFSNYLLQRPDFQVSKLALAKDSASADAVIRLGLGMEGRTTIAVLNRWTGERVSTASIWSGLPGMIAMDAIRELELACPGSVKDVPAVRTLAGCSAPTLAQSAIHSMSACSHTSWIDNGELYAALPPKESLQKMGVELRPACSSADIHLEVFHNLSQTENWFWQANLPDGQILTSGRVIAFQGKGVGQKIIHAALRQIALSSGEPLLEQVAAISELPPAARAFHARLLPYDLEQHDTHLKVYVDAERLRALDSRGNLVFDFSLQEFRDARLTREWWQPLALDDPTGLMEAIASPADAYGVGAYLGIGAVLAQIKLPWHSLELAWEKDGIVKTVAMEISSKNGKQLIRDLQSASLTQQPPRESCGAAAHF